MSEAAKQVGIPIMALTHTLLAIGLVLNFSSTTGRSAAALAALVAVPLVHIAILIGSKALFGKIRGWLSSSRRQSSAN